MYEKLLIVNEEGVAIVTINRPNVLNALDIKTIRELDQAIGELKENSAVKVVIITGAGEKAFVAGADITEFNALDVHSSREVAREGQAVFLKIEQLPKPVIAAINGYALGGGCELAMACDIRIASEKAKFGQPEINLGIIPGFGGTQRLPKLVGAAKAKELIFTGNTIDANEALRIGLVNAVVKPEELMTKAKEMARTIALKGTVAIKMAKQAINDGADMDIIRGCELEANAFALCFATEDQKEGAKAFLEKRTPQFKGK